jgi:hypothetical protein
MREWNLHHELYDTLKEADGKWIISSYDIPEIHSIFDDPKYYIVPIESFSGMKISKTDNKRKKNLEVLVLNFKPEHLLPGMEAYSMREKTNEAEKQPTLL